MNKPPSNRPMAWIANTVALCFTMLILAPSAAMARQQLKQQAKQRARNAPSAQTRMATTINAIHDELWRIEQTEPGKLYATRAKSMQARSLGHLSNLVQRMRHLDADVRSEFLETRKHIEAHHLSPLISQRQDELEARYKAEFPKLLHTLAALTEKAAHQALPMDTVRSALQAIEARQFRHRQAAFDPNDLPNKVMQANAKRVPHTAKAYYAKLANSIHAKTALVQQATAKRPGAAGPNLKNLPGADDPSLLAATVEVTLSDAIKTQAAALDHDPVKIFWWVKNHIDWLPTWGAMQSADITLGSRVGNSFDIASLLIALLRASGIPSRYVHGTVEVSAERFNNWAGGFDEVAAAIDYASAGGIPIRGVISGGTLARVRMEHIWVEAAIDYEPSRGAVNTAPDRWIPLDPSFKQYHYLEGLDTLAISGIDPDTLLQDFLASGQVNDQEGWVKGFDPAILEQAQQQMQAKLETYIEQNLQDPTVGEVIGGRKTILQEHPILPNAIENKIREIGARYASIPQPLQHRITFGFAQDLLSGDITDPLTYPWAQLNNQKVTLSFKPATQADEDALASLVEGITDPKDLPTTIPSSLIRVIPELKINGEVVKQGISMRLGEDLDFAMDVEQIGTPVQRIRKPVVAGSYLDVLTLGGSISSSDLKALQDKVSQTRATLESGDTGLIASITREDVLGDLFYAGGLAYFAEHNGLGQLASLAGNSHFALGSVVGTYGFVPQAHFLFGFPVSIQAGGVEMDLPWVFANAGPSKPDPTRKKALAVQAGIIGSALEAGIPEQMFINDANPGEAISTVTAIQKAIAAGQRIYQITRDNQAALANIHLDPRTMAEISDAVAAGKTVITHTDPISVTGFSAVGYVVMDPETGAAAYQIGGGGNGAVLMLLNFLVYLFISVFLFVALPVLITGLLTATAFTLATIFTALTIVESANDIEKAWRDCRGIGFVTAVITIFVNTALGIVGGLEEEVAGLLSNIFLYNFDLKDMKDNFCG